MNQFTTNQPIGSTVSDTPIWKEPCGYCGHINGFHLDKCPRSTAILGNNPVCPVFSDGATPPPPVNPTVTHLQGCAKLYGNLCSCGADHKTPINNCGEKYCSRIHPEAKAPTKLENQLVDILSHYCGERGDNEGAVETLERIVEERNTLLRRAVERDIFHKL